MSSATWQIVGDVAVFQTGQYGDIVIPLSSYNSFYDQIREINKQNTSYHEYYHLFNTEVKESDISLTEMNRLLSLYSTPFTDRFAGVGIVYPVPGVGGAVINVTSDQLHLLDPGIVMRQIIVVDGVYHVRTVGIGEGNFAALNTDPRIVDIVWGWIAGANLKQALFELGVPKCFAAGTQVLMADGSSLSIEAVKTGDFVMSFAGEESSGRGMLIPAKVVQTFKNITDEWLLIVPEREFEEVASKNGLTSMRVTPGHRMLASDGSFKEIQDIISFDSKLILSDGSVIRVSHEYIRSDLDAISAVDKYNSRQLELGSDAECFWKTYNFEVEDTHTYIAAGVRVHNDSLFLPQTDEAKLADDILSQISNIIFADNPWQNILIGSALRSFGTVAQDALFGDDDFNGELLLGRYALNVIDSVGGYAGRALVSALIDDADIDPALASALSIFAQQAGSNLAQLAALEFLAANAGGIVAFEAQQALDNSANGFNFGEIIASAGFAALGSYAGSQLADLLDMDPELAALVAGPTQAAIVKIGDNIIAGNPWNVGVSTSMLTSLGSVAGTILANNIGNFDTYSEQMGSNIGSNIGAFIFSSLGPVGTFIGSLLGGLLGGLIGGIFGDDPEGFADIEFNTLEDLYRITKVYGEDRAHKDVARDLAESHISIIKSILDLVDGDVLAGNVARLTFGFVEKEFSVKIDGQEYNLGSDAKSTINIGVFEALRSMEIAGGDVYARRAIHATLETYEEWSINTDGATAVPRTVIDPTGGSASTQETSSSDALNQLMSALMIAKEYQNYLRNISAINAIIAADPNSEFAIGWQMTLAQVFALGIHQRSEIDWTGGWDWWLQHNAVTSDKVVFTYLDGERWFVLGTNSPAVIADTIAPGQKDTISGGDRSDYIFVDAGRFDGDVSQSGKAGGFIGFNGFDRAGKTEIGFAARINGGAGDDQIYGGDLGNDLFGGAGDDLLIGGKLDDWLFGGDGNDVLLAGGGLGDVLDGGSGNDRLLGDDSEDWLSGGSGDDILRGFAGNDILEGGSGRDILIGGEGNDKYVYRADNGVDIITDSGVTGDDVIVFGNGILASDLIVHRSAVGDDLIIRINGNDAAFLVITGGLLTDFNGIERFEFSDGTVWTKGQMISASAQSGLPSVTHVGDGASANVLGTVGDDDLAGAGGNDVLQGGVGSDVYRFNLGDGADTIIDAGLTRDIDRVVFGAGIIPASLVLSRDLANSSVLVIGMVGTNDKLAIHYGNPDFSDGVELFEFADGTRLSYRELNKLYISQNQTTGNDVLVGGLGDEILFGGQGNDTLRGGGGYDQLSGGDGNDTYVYHRGDGYIAISESSGTDKLVFGEGVSLENIHLSVGDRDDRSLVITFRGMAGRIELLGQLSSSHIEQFELADGTVWSAEEIKSTLLARSADRNSDYIVGSTQADVLNGGAGDDRIYGYNDKDQIRGGAGDDVLIGGWHDDTYYYDLGDGNDVIVEGYGNGDIDKLIFGNGISLANLSYSQDPYSSANGWITFGNGERLTLLNMGRDYLGGVELLQTADGTTLDRQQILDLFRSSWMGSGKDVIRGFDTTDVLNGGAGDDRIYGYNDIDQIRGGNGDDVLIGGWHDDTYYYDLGDGNDVIVEGGYDGDNDRLVFGQGISLGNLTYSQGPYAATNGWITFGDGTRVTLLGLGNSYGSGIDRIETTDGTVLVGQQVLDLFRSSWMSAGKDVIRGFNAADVINGGDGDDQIYGYDGDDKLSGGIGDDVLIGGWGNDTYYYNLGDGNDVIVDATHQGEADRLVFGSGISLDNLSYSQDPYSSANGWITFANGERLILLNLGRYYMGGVEIIETADGAVLDRQQILDLFRSSWMSAGKDIIRGFNTTDIANGGAGDDRIYGYDGDDKLSGGTGNDVLIGGWGDDIYYYNSGDGNDIIVDASNEGYNDKLIFGAGISVSDLTFSFDAYDKDTLRIHLPDGSTIIIKDAFGSNGAGLESIEFVDGTVWNRSALAVAVGQQTATLNTIRGNSGVNTLTGTSANDSLDGLEGADTISGGAGDDVADGGLDNDTYLFGRGDGRDVFFGNSGTDTLKFGGSINASDINVRLYEINHEFLTLKIVGTTDEVSIRDVEKIEFADGTVWTEAQLYQVYADQNSTSGDDYIHTYDGNDIINAGAGDDLIYTESGNDIISGGAGDDYADGNWGNDTYIFNRGDGRDVFDGAFEIDTLRFGANISASEIVVRLMEADHTFLTLKIAGTTDEISIRDVEKIEFADGTVWTEAQLYQVYADQNSTSGDDYIHTYDGNDIINAGAGDDLIYTESGNDIISGGAGDDYADGNWGNDTYIFNRGDGRDVFDGAFEIDTLRFGANISASDIVVRLMEADHTFLTLKIAGTTDEVSIRDVEKIEFADGTFWTQAQLYQAYADQNSTSGDDYIRTSYLNDVINAGAGDDRIYAESGDDIISGGAGDDYADGGSGNNTYIFNRGDGRDVFEGGIYNDTVLFGVGISPADIIVRLNEADHSFLTLKIAGSTDEISIRYVEKISFANGINWTHQQLIQIYADQNSTSGDDYFHFLAGTAVVNAGAGDDHIILYQGNDVISGGIGDDYVDGNAGNDIYIFNRGDGKDVFYGSSGSDTLRFGPTITVGDLRVFSGPSDWTTIILPDTGDIVEISNVEFVEFADGIRLSLADLPKIVQQSSANLGAIVGTSANDILIGTEENDRLRGLAGDDRLLGGRGADTYVFGIGDGHDTIEEYPDTISTDTLELGNGITTADVFFEAFGQNSNDLILRIKSREETIVLKNQLTTNGAGIERLLFANGTIWTRENITANSGSNQPSSGDDVLTGTYRSDVLRGGGGNDVLKGGLGADRYLYSLGDGNDRISDFSSTEDIDELSFEFAYSGSGIVFQRASDGTSLLITVGGSSIVIENQLDNSGYGIDLVTFSSGEHLNRGDIEMRVLEASMTAGNDVIVGTRGNDIITGGAGNDVLDGQEGSDTYNFGSDDGHDVIQDGGQNLANDVIVFGPGIFSTSVLISREADGLYRIANNNNTWSVTLVGSFGGIEEFRFADGIVWTQANLKQAYYNSLASGNNGMITGDSTNEIINGGETSEIIRGGAGDDQLNGGAGDDVLFGDAGNDTLSGGAGNDTLEGGLGLDYYDGGNGFDTVDFSYSGADWVINLLGGQAHTLANPEGIETLVSIEKIVTGSGNDNLTGGIANEVLITGAGDDYLDGGAGDDELLGGKGDDVYNYGRGGGHDTVAEDQLGGNADRLVFNGLSTADIGLSRMGDDLIISVWDSSAGANDGGSITIRNTLGENSNSGIELFTLMEGTYTKADVQSVLLSQAMTANDDVIEGFRNTGDYLEGGAGNDAFVFKPNFGWDTIGDFVAGGGTDDVLEFRGSVLADFEAVLAAASQVGNDTIINIDGTNGITLANVNLADLHRDDVRFVA